MFVPCLSLCTDRTHLDLQAHGLEVDEVPLHHRRADSGGEESQKGRNQRRCNQCWSPHKYSVTVFELLLACFVRIILLLQLVFLQLRARTKQWQQW